MIKKKIVFSDYDGTIYIEEKDMDKNIKSIEKYRELGGKFVIVTGRSKTSIDNVIEEYKIKYDYLILNNGSIIFDNKGNKIYEQFIKPEISSKIIKYLKNKSNIEILYYDENDKVKYNNQELLKIRIKSQDQEMIKEIEKEINYLYKDEVIAHASFPTNYYENVNYDNTDIVSIKAGKEIAINELLTILDIKKEEVVTVGDGRNDIEMIKKYNGYSMETAEEEVKQVASKIFKNISEVLEYIEKVVI